jgi:hypothetical protein
MTHPISTSSTTVRGVIWADPEAAAAWTRSMHFIIILASAMTRVFLDNSFKPPFCRVVTDIHALDLVTMTHALLH